MNHSPLSRIRSVRIVAALGLVLFVAPALADVERHEVQIIKLKTGDAEVVEADVTDLVLGESLSLVSDSGRMVDILRGADGLEIYLDGELLDMPSLSDPSDAHATIVAERIEIECESASDDRCDESRMHALSGAEGGRLVVIDKERVEVICDGDEDTDCEVFAWSGDGNDGDFDVETIHQEGDHKIVVIRKEIDQGGDD